MEKITLVHTNDLHSHLEHWPKIRRYLNQRKQEADSSQETVISLDLGDFVDRWHPLTEATNGQANIELMNQGHYDAVTIGIFMIKRSFLSYWRTFSIRMI